VKELSFFILVFISIPIYSQAWTLTVDKTKDYPYDYRFSDLPVSEGLIEFKKGTGLSRIEVSDLMGDTSSIEAFMTINRLGRDSLVYNAEISAITYILLDTGFYHIKLMSKVLWSYETDIQIRDDEYVFLTARLANLLFHEVGYYHILSKIQLSDTEIQQIMDCVKETFKDPLKNCNDKKRYIVLGEI